MNNVGGLDRMARIAIGLALIVLAAVGVIGVWGFIGLVPLATGLLRSCPLYKVFGFSTCPISKE
ncbi:YgaP family membrane protein [Chitinibacter mangrovi]